MKKTKNINLIVAVLCVSAFALPARAETAESSPLPTLWSYNECVDYAKSHNISLQQSSIPPDLFVCVITTVTLSKFTFTLVLIISAYSR